MITAAREALCCNPMRAWIVSGTWWAKTARSRRIKFNGKLNANSFPKIQIISGTWEAMRGYEALEFDRTTRGLSSVRGCGNCNGGVQFARGIAGRAVRNFIWRGVGLRGIARGAYGFGFDSDCGAEH